MRRTNDRNHIEDTYHLVFFYQQGIWKLYKYVLNAQNKYRFERKSVYRAENKNSLISATSKKKDMLVATQTISDFVPWYQALRSPELMLIDCFFLTCCYHVYKRQRTPKWQ